MNLDRIPPQSLEAEQAILGCALYSSNTIPVIAEVLGQSGRAFYRESHKIIWETLYKMWAEDTPIDIVSVNDYMKNSSVLEEVGGIGYVAQLLNHAGTSSSASHYADIIQDRFQRRRMLDVISGLESAIHTDDSSVGELLANADAQLAKLGQDAGMSLGVLEPRQFVVNTYEHILERAQSVQVQGISTGFSDLDYVTGGIEPDALFTIVGDTGGGKTSMKMQIASHIAEHHGPILIVSMEMSARNLGYRFFGNIGRVDTRRIRSGTCDSNDIARIDAAYKKLYDLPIYVIADGRKSVSEVESLVRQYKPKGLKAIFVDYVTIMNPDNPRETRVSQVAQLSSGLKNIALRNEIPVITSCQYNRNKLKGQRPELDNIREAASIAHNSDIVAMIWVENPEQLRRDGEGMVKLCIEKARNGGGPDIPLHFNLTHTRFSDVTERGY